MLVQFEDRSHVATPVAVVGRGPDGDERVVEHVLVALHHQLMRARDQLDCVCRVELRNHVAAEEVAGAARAEAPAVNILRVGPHEVAHRPLVRRLLQPVEVLDLVDGVERGREAAVHAEHRVVDDGGEAEAVEDVDAKLPHVGVAVLLEALVVKAVDLRDLAALVVAADERHALRVPHFEREQQQKRLDRVVAAVDKVAHEDVVDRRDLPADVEELEQVVELAVDVADDGGGDGHVVDVLLLHQNLLGLLAQRLHLILRDDLALFQCLDVRIEVRHGC
mmetsp:Transcript_3559/g.6806  ORF Transcript_3559/g.6806 Transcript_3559/m.6806 type:complete len:278 (+) Transcript_3559:505-1338(+)